MPKTNSTSAIQEEADGPGEGETRPPDLSPLTPVILLQRVKYLLTPREPNRWAVEREGATPYNSRAAMNGALVKPTHIIVETMM